MILISDFFFFFFFLFNDHLFDQSISKKKKNVLPHLIITNKGKKKQMEIRISIGDIFLILYNHLICFININGINLQMCEILPVNLNRKGIE